MGSKVKVDLDILDFSKPFATVSLCKLFRCGVDDSNVAGQKVLAEWRVLRLCKCRFGTQPYPVWWFISIAYCDKMFLLNC